MQAIPFITVLNDFVGLFGEREAINMLKLMISMKTKKGKKEEIVFLLTDFLCKTKNIDYVTFLDKYQNDKVHYLYRAMLHYLAINSLEMSYRQVGKIFNTSSAMIFQSCGKFDVWLLSADKDVEIYEAYTLLTDFCKSINH